MIVLSAGHYESAPGACFEGRCEFSEAMPWVGLIYTQLLKNGVECRVCPPGHLKQKVKFINDNDADYAIEIHFNSAGGKGNGVETLYCPHSETGRRFARAVHSVYAPLMGRDRGTKEGWYRMDRPGVKDYSGDVEGDEKPDYFLRMTKCPAIILEPAFIHEGAVIEDTREIACQVIASTLTRINREGV